MEAYLLGTSTSIGMPAPLCDCTYCDKIERKRPSLLVKSRQGSVLFDVSPDFREQTHLFEGTSIEHVFVTHHHHDHSTGIMDLYHLTREPELGTITESKKEFVKNFYHRDFNMYYSPETHEILYKEMGYILDSESININIVDDSETVKVGGVRVTPFITEHAHGYLGYVIEDGSEKLVYNPDYGTPRTSVDFSNTDVLVTDGGPLLGYKIHGRPDEAESFISQVNAEKVFLTNVSEHTAQESTEVLKDRAAGYECSIVDDGSRVL